MNDLLDLAGPLKPTLHRIAALAGIEKPDAYDLGRWRLHEALAQMERSSTQLIDAIKALEAVCQQTEKQKRP